MSKIILELSTDEAETLTTIIFEFCESIDNRKDKHGNYKSSTWSDCLQLRDKLLKSGALSTDD